MSWWLALALQATPTAPPPLPPPLFPAVTKAKAGTNLAAYLSEDDYPVDAIRNGEEGTVAFTLEVTPQGRVGGCTIVASSGSATLDEATCRLMTTRPRFAPALDQFGNPTRDSFFGRIRWVLPVVRIARFSTLEVTLAGPNARFARASDCHTIEEVAGERSDTTDEECRDFDGNPLQSALREAARKAGRTPVRVRLTMESLLDGEPERPFPSDGRLVGSIVHRIELAASGKITTCAKASGDWPSMPDVTCEIADWFDPARLSGAATRARIVQRLFVVGENKAATRPSAPPPPKT
ncbi:hypothetical protein GCM10022281_02500 [Sphingomonas rosea]|uniref:TonB C-terminal domain-containing protein n=1 Tax=Sphingomonas rosea TaxID=335605 RepID=A0ABP7TK32_9SPHN